MTIQFKTGKLFILLTLNLIAISINATEVNRIENFDFIGDEQADSAILDQSEKQLLYEALFTRVNINRMGEQVEVGLIEILKEECENYGFATKGRSKKPLDTVPTLKRWCKNRKHTFFNDIIKRDFDWNRPGVAQIPDSLMQKLCVCNIFDHLSHQKEVVNYTLLWEALFRDKTLLAVKERMYKEPIQIEDKSVSLGRLFKNWNKLEADSIILIHILIINPANFSNLRKKSDLFEHEIGALIRKCAAAKHGIYREIMDLWFKINSGTGDVYNRGSFCLCRILNPNFGSSTHVAPKHRDTDIDIEDTYRAPADNNYELEATDQKSPTPNGTQTTTSTSNTSSNSGCCIIL